MTPIVVVMVVAPLMAWKRGDLPGVLGRLKFAAAGTVVVVLAALWLHGGGPVLALLGIGFGVWVLLRAATELPARVPLFRIPIPYSPSPSSGLTPRARGAAFAHSGPGPALPGLFCPRSRSHERVSLAQPPPP